MAKLLSIYLSFLLSNVTFYTVYSAALEDNIFRPDMYRFRI